MKIAILHPSYEGSTAPYKDLDPECDPSPHLPGHSYHHFSIRKPTAVRQVIEAARGGFDVAINLCDGAWDEDRPGIEVVQALERLQVAFTGAGSGFYDPTREAMKMACHAAGLAVPAYVLARSAVDVGRALETLKFPMIVKHPNSYASIGMTRDSRVTDAAALHREVVRFLDTYCGALVEEFIEGREFTVMVTEPRAGETAPWALQPVEFVFPPGESFKHFDLKWIEFRRMKTRLVADPKLDARLREVAAKTFSGLAGSGYGRCDLRVTDAGDIYMLEINPNCEVFCPEGEYGSADFILAHDPAGHHGFLQHIIDCAIRRRDRATRCWEIRFNKGAGFGMYASRAIRTGEIVEHYEERPQVLVSRRHVERDWHGVQRRWFDQYAWPITDETYAIWSDRPEDWRPMNHSCEPNMWLDGLNLTARRDIAPGEALTVEYATFCGVAMQAFQCRCGSPSCRGTIRGSDHLLPEIRRRYADHVSDHVRTLWDRAR